VRWSRFFHPCLRKVRYETLTAVRKAAQERMDEGAPQLYAYRCPFFPDHWHMSHRQQKGSIVVGKAARKAVHS
jgi:hypothetical protein